MQVLARTHFRFLLAAAAAWVPACLWQAAAALETATDSEPRNAVLAFAGRLSTSDLGNTMIFNLHYQPPAGQPSFDNDIAGVEYERDLRAIAPDLRLRFEGGVAERFGHYLVCCSQLPYPKPLPDLTQRLDGRVYSTELWFGPKLRWENLHLGPELRLEISGTLGLSGVTRTIGRERQREMDDHGNAHLLYYIAPEIGASLRSLPRLELVIRIPHRSGGDHTLGNMEEGYNADIVGVRYSF